MQINLPTVPSLIQENVLIWAEQNVVCCEPKADLLMSKK